MLAVAIAQFFKLKVVGSVIVLTCNWLAYDEIQLTRQLSEQGVRATFSCDPGIISNVVSHRFQGVLYFKQGEDTLLDKTKREHFSHWFKWLVIGNELPEKLHGIRYDSDVVYVQSYRTNEHSSFFKTQYTEVSFQDVFVHPKYGASLHSWALWTNTTGIAVTNGNRTLRRLNMQQYPLKIVAPVGQYSPSSYNGSFAQYLTAQADPQRDAAIRCAYTASSLIIETLNASEILLETQTWSSLISNDSMLRMVELGLADLTGAILRCLPFRLEIMDFILPIWPFSVGFTYLAERESSSNMYVEPFTVGVWWSVAGIGVVLALAQRLTARRGEEKEGAYIGVLATWLQQDASAVPEGASGRWTFMVMSTSAMLVHAYYTSAIVSALMSTGRGGPDSLRALGDSKYAIASEDYEYMRYLFWDVETNWIDLEYLKKKKMTSKMYQEMEKGIELIKDGSTAYHTEYNQLYPHFSTLSDDQLCKLQYIDTIPEQLTWTTTTKRSQYTDVFRSRGAWLRETGLAHRLVGRLRMRPPPCRASLLAERVTFGDVTPLLGLTALGAMLSLFVLGLEILYSKGRGKREKGRRGKKRSVSEASDGTVEVEEYGYVD